MSSRVGTAIPASRSTALSSSGGRLDEVDPDRAFRQRGEIDGDGFLQREVRKGRTPRTWRSSGNQAAARRTTQQDLARFWQALMTGGINRPVHICGGQMAAAWRRFGGRGRSAQKCSRKPQKLRQKRHSRHAASRDEHLSSGIMADFGDNGINEIVAFRAQARGCATLRFRLEHDKCRRLQVKTGNPGRRPDAVGLHAGHDLSRPHQRGQLQAARQGTAGQGALRQSRASPSRSAAPSSTITARKRRARSWSIPTITISITCRMAARRSATASPSAKKPWPGPASPRSAA